MPLEKLEEIHPQELLQRETTFKPPEPPAFSEKMEPVTKGLVEDTRLYSLIFENAPLGEIINAILTDTGTTIPGTNVPDVRAAIQDDSIIVVGRSQGGVHVVPLDKIRQER